MEPKCVIAIDAMGGDRAPGEIVAGALDAAARFDVGVLLAGRREAIEPLFPDGTAPDGVEVLDAREVVEMGEDPVAAVRSKKDSSLARATEAVADGRAHALVGAGNTGATMAGALLRWGRIRGVARPGIAVPIPVPGSRPQILIDGGATVDCDPEWLVQFARMARAYATVRFGTEAPTVGLLSNGEEPGKGDDLRKRTFPLLEAVDGFVGNVEARDLMTTRPDIVVTDGFTGNIALKTLEGALRQVSTMVFAVLDSTPEARGAAEVITPMLIDAAADLDPDATGGAVLLGVKGVCVISHGASSARAIVNAIKVATDCVEADVVGQITTTLAEVSDAR